MKQRNIITIIAVSIAITACERDEIFEREQYKHVIAIVSEGSTNIFAEEHDLSIIDGDGFTEGYIGASCGGALPTDQTATLTVMEDAELLSKYNNDNFATESYKYARYLPSDRYKIDNPSIIIPKGERNGRMKIKVKAAGLSPDSVYFLPLRAVRCSAYELNPNKSTVLYRVYMKNFWSSVKSVSVYSHRGVKTEKGTSTGINTMMTKSLYPLSGNEVRMIAGNKVISELTAEILEKWAVKLSVDNSGNVTVSPCSSSRFGMKVTQVDGDPDYPNVFKLLDNGYGKIYKTFLLNYDYTDPDEGVTYNIKEELKVEHIITVK
ncbi:MAG: DUF4361 domain-containing protein [Tannerella sp.]|jgi:hypothetical protein|nr:DUF4361 domain-containing protein [Tannerella sp.]